MMVKKLRAEKNWSQEQLATFSDLSIRTIQCVESSQSASKIPGHLILNNKK